MKEQIFKRLAAETTEELRKAAEERLKSAEQTLRQTVLERKKHNES